MMKLLNLVFALVLLVPLGVSAQDVQPAAEPGLVTDGRLHGDTTVTLSIGTGKTKLQEKLYVNYIQWSPGRYIICVGNRSSNNPHGAMELPGYTGTGSTLQKAVDDLAKKFFLAKRTPLN